MQRVFVLAQNNQPLMPCHPARARALISSNKAKIVRRFPFTIQLQQKSTKEVQPIHLKVDPGSKTTGITLVALFQQGFKAIWAANLSHRGHKIKRNLDKRRACRRARRSRNLRYRKPRFLNRKRSIQKGWLPPSLMSRVYNIETWALRLKHRAPLSAVDVETVRFDTQLINDATISGVQYQQGTLKDWELREYLLYRHKHSCAYCQGLSADPILEKEHVQPKSNGGTNSVTNLVIACRTCNQEKKDLDPNDWLIKLKKSRTKLNQMRAKNLAKILLGIRPRQADMAVMNATRYKVGSILKDHFEQVEFWSGGRTKKNRVEQGYRKDHWIDAAVTGISGEQVFIPKNLKPLLIQAMGHGSRQFCKVNKYGFPRTAPKPRKATVHGFSTGDLVRAIVPSGKKKGTYIGRVAIRSNGYFNIKTNLETIQGISWKHCIMQQKSDGYAYAY